MPWRRSILSAIKFVVAEKIIELQAIVPLKIR